MGPNHNRKGQAGKGAERAGRSGAGGGEQAGRGDQGGVRRSDSTAAVADNRRPGLEGIYNRLRKEKPRAASTRLLAQAKEEWHQTHGVHLRVEGGNVKACRNCGHAPEAVEVEATRNAMGYWRLSCPTRRCREKWAARGHDYLTAVACWNEKQEVPHA